MMYLLIALLLTNITTDDVNTSSVCYYKGELQAYHRYKGEVNLAKEWNINNDKFSLSFIHSATLTPVMSHYEVRLNGTKREIIQIGEEFKTHGYGLPSFKNDLNIIEWIERDGKFILIMERPVEPFIVRISKEYKNTLHIDEKVYTLDDFDGKPLEFRIKCQ